MFLIIKYIQGLITFMSLLSYRYVNNIASFRLSPFQNLFQTMIDLASAEILDGLTRKAASRRGVDLNGQLA